MQQKATMFLNDITAIDHAWVNRSGTIVGDSCQLSALVTGEIDSHEEVVVDFSQIKKDIKRFIDGPDGFDHKLWLVSGVSNYTIESDSEDRLTLVTLDQTATKAGHLLEGTRDSFRFFDVNPASEYATKEGVSVLEIENFLEEKLNNLYPDKTISVEVSLSNHIHTNSFRLESDVLRYFFTYVHGLKNSSSYGCQNLFHGHYSYVEFHFEPGEKKDISKLQSIVRDMNYAIFIWKENVMNEDDTHITVQYTSDRGKFAAVFSKTLNKIIVLETETTIEHLVQYFVEKNRGILKALGVGSVSVSEGLSKGAIALV